MKKVNYFDNQYVEEQIIRFQQTRDNEILNDLLPIFNKLISGVIERYRLLRRNYINDDIAQEAWVGILESAPRWSKEKGDAFSYFTGVVRNKIFWYLKAHYKDTSMNSNDPETVNIDDESIDVRTDESHGVESESVIRDYILKLTPEALNLPEENEEYGIILESIKAKIAHNDSVKYEDLIKETQKEIGHPKKKVRFVLDSIYAHFMDQEEI
jgi:DNA-directed RNA polymerase specialized sigma24 family protein